MLPRDEPLQASMQQAQTSWVAWGELLHPRGVISVSIQGERATLIM